MTLEEKREKDKQAKREERAWCKANGVCQCCKKAKVEDKKVFCFDCADRRNARTRERRNTEQYRQYHAERERQRRATKKENGICHNCSKPVYQNKCYCYECLLASRKKDRRLYDEKERPYTKPTWYRKEIGMCSWCDSMELHSERLCKACYDKVIEKSTSKMIEAAKNIPRQYPYLSAQPHYWDDKEAAKQKERERKEKYRQQKTASYIEAVSVS